jgi:iron complex transport system permease protein
MTAASVAICGKIGWIGLVVPHFSRMLVGYDYRILLPTSILMGSTFLLLVDIFARYWGIEYPLGMLTAFIGVPFFLYLLLNKRYRM